MRDGGEIKAFLLHKHGCNPTPLMGAGGKSSGGFASTRAFVVPESESSGSEAGGTPHNLLW